MVDYKTKGSDCVTECKYMPGKMIGSYSCCAECKHFIKKNAFNQLECRLYELSKDFVIYRKKKN